MATIHGQLKNYFYEATTNKNTLRFPEIQK